MAPQVPPGPPQLNTMQQYPYPYMYAAPPPPQSGTAKLVVQGFFGLIVLALIIYIVIKMNEAPAKPKPTGTGSSPAGSGDAPSVPASKDIPPATKTKTPTEAAATNTGGAVANVRYVRIQRVEASPGSQSLNISELAVYNAGVLLPLVSGSIYPPFHPELYGWEKLKDVSPATFAHSDSNPTANITVDLGAAKTVDEVVVVNRTDCCSERIVGSELQLLDGSMQILKKWAFKDVPDTLAAQKGAARYRVGVATNMVLQTSV